MSQSRTAKNKRPSAVSVYDALRRMIVDFDLFPGARVTESELADYFQVSRTPVREALQRLSNEGLILIRPKQGCFVRQVDIEQISNYYDVRVALEAMAVELACERMSDTDLRALAEVWNPARCPGDLEYVEDLKDTEESFHITLALGANNPELVNYLRDVNDRIRVIRRLGFPDETSVVETYQEHFDILSLLLERNAEAAKDAMIKHIRKSQNIARSVTLNQLEQHRKRHVLGSL
ncbi:MAG TPA: GntR family transcriptional regulator [Pseudomonadales bacterium]|nr:GntR family transcriptional regulator [Pseudomonadales bacterium]